MDVVLILRISTLLHGPRNVYECTDCTVEFWGSIIGQEIFAQNRGFIKGKVVKIMISEG